MTLDDAEYLTVEDAARRWGIDADAMSSLVRGGVVPMANLGPAGWRVRRTDLERLLAQRRRAESSPDLDDP